jgi:hypothetical protein
LYHCFVWIVLIHASLLFVSKETNKGTYKTINTYSQIKTKEKGTYKTINTYTQPCVCLYSFGLICMYVFIVWYVPFFFCFDLCVCVYRLVCVFILLFWSVCMCLSPCMCLYS